MTNVRPPKKQPMVGDSCFYLQIDESGRLTKSPAVITDAIRNSSVVSLFVMFKHSTASFVDVTHGAADGCWCYSGEFGI